MINSPYNKRQDTLADKVVRGKILDKNGNILAQTNVAEDGTETREYPYGSLFAHTVGYTANGKAGIESFKNFDLLTSNAFFMEKLKNEFDGKKNVGDNVVTTLDADLQKAASNAMGSNKGAVVVLEASTGKILTMLSQPTYDPSTVADNWDALNSDAESALLNRATQGSYAPGSTFKIITALEYMREYSNYTDYSYNCQGYIEKDGTKINCSHGNVHGQQNLSESFANSCNSSFANIGLQLNLGSYQETAKKLLFNSNLPGDFSYTKSKFSLASNASSADVMMTAMGQGQTLTNPYHMALIVDAVANGGKLMKPYVVDSITNYTGSVMKQNSPESYGELMTAGESAQLTEYMKAVVDQGTAKVLSNSSYSVAGKTGTAEYSSNKDQSHSWFVGFSNVDNPDIVVSVIVEGSDGGTRATSVAKEVFDTYYQK